MSKDWTQENLDIVPVAENGAFNHRSELEAARYWEGQAFIWHERYKDGLKYELDHATFMEALERLASGKWTAERGRAIARMALNKSKVQ